MGGILTGGSSFKACGAWLMKIFAVDMASSPHTSNFVSNSVSVYCGFVLSEGLGPARHQRAGFNSHCTAITIKHKVRAATVPFNTVISKFLHPLWNCFDEQEVILWDSDDPHRKSRWKVAPPDGESEPAGHRAPAEEDHE